MLNVENVGKEKLSNPFDYVKSILNGNTKLKVDKEYNSFLINRALSYHKDCIFIANEVNNFSNLDNDIQYDFLLNIIRKRYRKFKPWHKNSISDDIKIIMEFFNVGFDDALEYLEILKKTDKLEKIKKCL